jgi:glutamate/tyrosine decarboxylase-like PLP-dependent enzyme
MRPQDVRLPPELADRLARRAPELLELGSLRDERHAGREAERRALAELSARLDNTYPYPAAAYAGQMLKPPHAVAWAAYATAMLLNPNNHALDGGPATAEMEREAVAALAGMLSLDPHLGHLTSSGTIANLEALWVARELAPDATIVSGANAHYTHARMATVLGARHEVVAEDDRGRIDPDALAARLAAGGVGTVVATLGTTSLGAVDRLDVIAHLCCEHGARLHVDAAYGGFFALVAGAPDGVEPEAFAAAARADSIVIDPHKHGLQPYGCGCVLFADPAVGRLYAHDSPYTYFTSEDLHLGEISLECSRAGAAAAALWTTLRTFPLTAQGLGSFLAAARRAGLALAEAVRADERLALVVEPELDIVCPFACAASAAAITAASERAFDRLAAEGWHVAKLRLDTAWLRRSHPWIEADAATTTVLRSCLMKPEHLEVVEELAVAIGEALATGD